MVDLPIFGNIIRFPKNCIFQDLVNGFGDVMGRWNGTEEYYTQIKIIYSVFCDLLFQSKFVEDIIHCDN